MQQAADIQRPHPAPAGSLEYLYRSDGFRMDCMKVVPCSKHYVHDWTECPFAHPHEKARRRDPHRHQYTGIACPSMRQAGVCTLRDNCPYAHNVFEYWLHPTRYRTQLCNDGTTCKRKLCFFAHSLEELRTPENKPFVPAEAVVAAAVAAAAGGTATDVLAAAAAAPQPHAEAAAAQHAPLHMPAPTQKPKPDGPASAAEEHPLVELMTRLVARGKVTPERSAAILQQVLSPGVLHDLRGGVAPPAIPSAGECTGRSSSPLDWAARQGSSPSAMEAAVAAARSQHVRHSIDGAMRPNLLNPHRNAVAAGAPPDFAVPGAGLEQGPSVAEMRLALLQGALHEAQARATLSLDGCSARSSIDTARASFESMQCGSGLAPSPCPSWDATYTSIMQQQLMLGSLQQHVQATAASSSLWAPAPPARLSLDSQLSSDGVAVDGARSSVESSRMSRGARSSMDGPPLSPAARQMSQDLARMSLEA